MAVALAILAALSYGGADFLGGIAAKRAAPAAVVAGVALVGLALLVVPALLADGQDPTTADLVWGGAAGLAGGVAVMTFYAALARGVMSVVAPVTAVISAVVPVAAGLALGEEPGPVPLFGVGLAVLAITLLARGGADPDPTGTHGRDRRLLAAAAVAGVGFGSFYVLLDRTREAAGLWPLVPTRLVTAVLMLVVLLVTRSAVRLPRSSARAVMGAGALDVTANVLFLVANRSGLLSLIAVVASMYPASTIALAYGVLGERLRRHQVIGLAVAVAAVALIIGG